MLILLSLGGRRFAPPPSKYAFGSIRLTRKIIPKVTYNVLSGMLNPAMQGCSVSVIGICNSVLTLCLLTPFIALNTVALAVLFFCVFFYPPFARRAKGEVCLFVCSVNDFSATRGPIHAKFCMRA